MSPSIQHCIILAHPSGTSFCASVADTYRRAVESCRQTVIVRDLYAMGFDPVLRDSERPGKNFKLSTDVASEIAAIAESDIFVLVYPIWFGTPPAILKGYIERVLGSGFSFRAVHDQQPHSFLKGKRLYSFSSSGTSWAWLNEKGAWMSLKNVFDVYFMNAFSLARSDHHHFHSISEVMKEQFVKENLHEVHEIALRTCAELRQSSRWPTSPAN